MLFNSILRHRSNYKSGFKEGQQVKPAIFSPSLTLARTKHH